MKWLFDLFLVFLENSSLRSACSPTQCFESLFFKVGGGPTPGRLSGHPRRSFRKASAHLCLKDAEEQHLRGRPEQQQGSEDSGTSGPLLLLSWGAGQSFFWTPSGDSGFLGWTNLRLVWTASATTRISKQRMLQPSSHHIAATLAMHPEGTQDVQTQDTGSGELRHTHQRTDFSEPRLLHLLTHRKVVNSLTWDMCFSLTNNSFWCSYYLFANFYITWFFLPLPQVT